MRLLSIIPSVLALLAGIAAASAPPAQYHTKVCQTRQVATRPKTKAHTYCSTRTTSCTKHKTIDTTVTVTPKCTTTVTSTTTTTKTVASTTGTATTTTTTTTATSTSTSTTTVTTTTITSTIVSTSTSTVPTSDGFITVETSLPGASNQLKAAGKKEKKRRRGPGAANVRTSANPRAVGRMHNGLFKRGTYPGDVQCYEYYGRCTTVVHTHTCTRTAAKTTVTSTATATSTVTTAPGGVTTTTVLVRALASTTTVSTSTSTTTSTSTNYLATTTVYDACATNNIANYVSNKGIVVPNLPSNDQANFDIVRNVGGDYNCCVASYLGSQGAWYYLKSDDFCVIVSPKTGLCQVGRTLKSYVSSYSNTDPSYSVGNGFCGYWTPPPPPDPNA